MTENEVLEYLKSSKRKNDMLGILPGSDIENTIIKALEELQQYRTIGTVEELQKAEKEENILKFYYCNSEDSYLVGLRIGNFYYAHYLDGSWVFDMPRYLPWGVYINNRTHPSKPREINFSEWLEGFVKKECGGTLEECRKAMTVKREVQEIVDQQLIAGKNNYKETYDCFWEIVKVVQANY